MTPMEWLESLRKANGQNISQFALWCGIVHSTYRNWLRGETEPQVSKIKSIAKYIGIDIPPDVKLFQMEQKSEIITPFDWVERIRCEHRMVVSEFCDFVYITKEMYYRWKNNATSITRVHLTNIAGKFHVDIPSEVYDQAVCRTPKDNPYEIKSSSKHFVHDGKHRSFCKKHHSEWAIGGTCTMPSCMKTRWKDD